MKAVSNRRAGFVGCTSKSVFSRGRRIKRCAQRIQPMVQALGFRLQRCPAAQAYMDEIIDGKTSTLHDHVQSLAGAAVICGFSDAWVLRFVSCYLSACTGYTHKVIYRQETGSIHFKCDFARNGVTQESYLQTVRNLTMVLVKQH